MNSSSTPLTCGHSVFLQQLQWWGAYCLIRQSTSVLHGSKLFKFISCQWVEASLFTQWSSFWPWESCTVVLFAVHVKVLWICEGVHIITHSSPTEPQPVIELGILVLNKLPRWFWSMQSLRIAVWAGETSGLWQREKAVCQVVWTAGGM